MPTLAFRLASPKLLVDLRHVLGLDRITIDGSGVTLGAKVRWRDIELDEGLKTAHPLFSYVSHHEAHYKIRNRGTIGGSLAHADPSAELPAVAVMCETSIIALGPERRRSIPTSEFFVSPLVTALGPHEVILALQFPFWPRLRRHGFAEFARRRGDFALAGVALYCDDDHSRVSNAHIGAFGVGNIPLRLVAAECALNGHEPDELTIERATAAAAESLNPSTDIHADSDYRRALFATLLRRTLARAAAQASA